MRLETEELIAEYWQSVYAAAYIVCQNRMDAEDAAQDSFVRYYANRKQFESREHIKAWLLRCAMNRAKDMTRSFFRKNKVELEDYLSSQEEAESTGEELFMRAALDDLALLQYHDGVRVSDGGEPVRDHEGGAVFHQVGPA